MRHARSDLLYNPITQLQKLVDEYGSPDIEITSDGDTLHATDRNRTWDKMQDALPKYCGDLANVSKTQAETYYLKKIKSTACRVAKSQRQVFEEDLCSIRSAPLRIKN